MPPGLTDELHAMHDVPMHERPHTSDAALGLQDSKHSEKAPLLMLESLRGLGAPPARPGEEGQRQGPHHHPPPTGRIGSQQARGIVRVGGEEQEPDEGESHLELVVIAEDEGSQDADEEPTQGSASGHAEVEGRERPRWRAKAVELAVHDHAEAEEQRAVEGDLCVDGLNDLDHRWVQPRAQQRPPDRR